MNAIPQVGGGLGIPTPAFPGEGDWMGIGTRFSRGKQGNEFEFPVVPMMRKGAKGSFMLKGSLIPSMRIDHPAGRSILTQKSKFRKGGLDTGSEPV